ncbi:hypothetical protein AJ79_03427 [Helicocarpus griseus UAMH5409]|uniref:UDP-glucose 6-dehydrogenase n=1 Tax=Helicocarpus griseus UAMH5409 TaxID=1447875 RepID=A0A2B7XY59_9EURO|nr:hypothetical protein AJ79_03427 [Helicocarpus griseus UAMH5409]
MAQNICCIGAGYVGGPTSAVIAKHCPELLVTVVDQDEQRITAWKSCQLPLHEPNLYETVVLPRDGIPGKRSPNLFFTTDFEHAVADADLILLCVETPTKDRGHGAGYAFDLGRLEVAVRRIAPIIKSNTIIVEKSTVPCKTADRVREMLEINCSSGVNFEVLSNPEFLSQGTMIADLEKPDRVVVGSGSHEAGRCAATVLENIYAHWVPRSRIVQLNVCSSELAKIVANCFLAQRISNINTLSAVCEETGSDINEVSQAVGLDRRVGPHMLQPSVGFGGSCFKKDILSLVYTAESLHLPQVAAYWKSVVDINEWQKDRFVKLVLEHFNGTVTSRRISVLGFTYKANTDDTRESAAISIVSSLVDEGAQICVYDPHASKDQIYKELYCKYPSEDAIDKAVFVSKDPYEACTEAQAILVLTGWDEFKLPETSETERVKSMDNEMAQLTCAEFQSRKHLDWRRMSELVSKPKLIFDGSTTISGGLTELGFRVIKIGSPKA